MESCECDFNINEKALRETQTLRAAYAGGVTPSSIFVPKVIRGQKFRN